MGVELWLWRVDYIHPTSRPAIQLGDWSVKMFRCMHEREWGRSTDVRVFSVRLARNTDKWSRVLDVSKDGPQPKGTGRQIYTKKSQDCPGGSSGRKQPRLMLRKRRRT